MPRFRIICEDCEFEAVRDDAEPPGGMPEQEWDARTAAKGVRDTHAKSEGHTVCMLSE